jgi:hypothetical protein
MRDLDADPRIILKYILKKWGLSIWALATGAGWILIMGSSECGSAI